MIAAGSKSIKTLTAEILRRFSPQMHDMPAVRRQWRAIVGEPMAAHSEPIQYEAGRLTVAADGPAWASRVRQQHAALIRALRTLPTCRALREIKVRIQPTKPARAPSLAAARPSRISQAAARLVVSVAQSVSDPQLRAALERLGRRGDKIE